MPHIEVRNATPFVFDAIVATDEEAVPHYVPLVQATYTIASGQAVLVEEQPAIVLGGEWHGDPADSSLRLEPQVAFFKPATDVVLLGHAHAAGLAQSAHQVGIRIGTLEKRALVFGDRVLHRHRGRSTMSDEAPFEKMPLLYERAFGGWDRRATTLSEHRFEPANPVGRGYRGAPADGDDDVALPNLENPQRLFSASGAAPPPTGFGFVAANWQPRLALAGTYDEAWSRSRKPLLPKDFDRRFFNAASPGLVAPSHLKGNEQVLVIGTSPKGRVEFSLPGAAPPEIEVHLRGRRSAILLPWLDTVIVDTDLDRLVLLWRAHIAVRGGAHDVLAVDVAACQVARVAA